MEALDLDFEGATDRATGVVHEHVDAAVVVEQPLGQRVAFVELREVGGIHVGLSARPLDPVADVFEPIPRAGYQHDAGARRAELERGRAADARRRAGDQHPTTAGRVRQRRAVAQVGVELVLPVVPQQRGIGLERRNLDAASRQGSSGVPTVESRG